MQPGAFVKLIFLFMSEDDQHPIIECERMWVTVRQRTATGYIGVLESLPATSDVIGPGDEIHFTADHVATVFVALTDPQHPNHGAKKHNGEGQESSE